MSEAATLSHKAFKYRIYPNKEQKTTINKTIGCSRFVYNHFLALWNKTREETGKGLKYKDCSSQLPFMKKEEATSWLAEADSMALQSACKNLENGFKGFFKKTTKHPVFKKKSSARQSYTTKNNKEINNIAVVEQKIKLPKLGLVKAVISRPIEGRIIRATVSRTASDKYYVSLICELETLTPLPLTGSSVGLDLGLSHFAVMSDGNKVENLRFVRGLDKKLKREQRKMSRRALLAKADKKPLREAKNYQKQRIIVARIHEKIAHQRGDFLHKLSTEIIKNHDVVCIEDLAVKNLMKNHKLARAIGDVSWSSFTSMLEYKAKWYGKQVVKAGRFYPSSQICSQCERKDGKKALHVRQWRCPQCGATHDRDVNAAQNLLREGLSTLKKEPQELRG